jgi:hypothetical protein
MGDRKGAYTVLMGRHERKRPLGRPRRRWEVILKWIIKKWDGTWTGFTCLGKGTSSGFL